MKMGRIAGGLLVVLSLPAQAEITINAQQIPGVYMTDGSGIYNKIYDEVKKQVPDLPNLDIVNPGRAIGSYVRGQVSCLTPANSNSNFYDVPFKTIESMPFNLAKIYAFTAPGKPTVSSIADLKGKKIAVRQGFSYGRDLETAGLQFDKGQSIEANVRKLLDGRVDVVVDFVPDAWEAFDALKMAPLPHVADKPLAVHVDAIVCKDTPETQALISKISDVLLQLKASGKLKEILGSGYIAE